MRARIELIALFEMVELGDSRETLEARFENGDYHTLRMTHLTTEESLVRTPLEWGARNWLMWVEFDDDRIDAVRIRFQDSRAERPVSAQHDKTAVSEN